MAYCYDDWDEKIKASLEEVWSVQEVADRWKVHPRTVTEMLRKGELKGFKIRKDWRVYLSEVLRYEGEDPRSKEHLRPQAVLPMPKPVVMRIK